MENSRICKKKIKLSSNSYGKSKDISGKCLIFTVMEN